jgi:hypothetical protein
MSIARRDWLRRIVEDFGRVLAELAGLRQSGKLDEAEQSLKETADGLLGGLVRDAELLESASLCRLLGSPERLRCYAALIAERAEIRAQRGDAAGAALDRRRALELGHERTST